jgi:hypothetical protein
MAKLVDARDLKSLGSKELCRFESGCPHQARYAASIDAGVRRLSAVIDPDGVSY